MSEDYLKNLNEAQIRAVQHAPDIPLQILAGPGSGKTRVLTCRIAHLIQHHGISPENICAVTFTNKAASEMRERLDLLVGKQRTSSLKMGTFHAICATFLRRYAGYAGIESNFSVCGADESKKIIKKLLEPHQKSLISQNLILKDESVLSAISKAKAKGKAADDLLAECSPSRSRRADSGDSLKSQHAVSLDQLVANIYQEYEMALRKSNSLDFDDLLIFGVKLFAENRWIGSWCKHILVDEFQDTNTMQYQFMRHVARANKCVTIVGDPDQSIYGWRSAEVENLTKMQIGEILWTNYRTEDSACQDFPRTQQIFLEQNYRSTGSILALSLAIISQGGPLFENIVAASPDESAPDRTRIQKTLRTTQSNWAAPVLRKFPTEQIEAASIAAEIKRLIAFTGGMLAWSDFVVLLRFTAHSRLIESSLQRAGIPNRVLGGQRFFERQEVKDILAYLQLIDNPQFAPAFTRAINVPSRGIGDKTVSHLLSAAETMRISPLEVANRIYNGTLPDIRPSVKRKLASFVPHIDRLTQLALQGTSPVILIRNLLELIDYKAHLGKTQQDWENRWDNIQELVNFARETESQEDLEAQIGTLGDAGPIEVDDFNDDYINVDSFREIGGRGKEKASTPGLTATRTTPLRRFLQASLLSTDTETEADERRRGKVTISTCHAAKGLEWPVVMIPGVEKGIFPSHRAEDIYEERRLLYVACTRAQGLLYLSHTNTRMVSGKTLGSELSEFVWPVISNNPVAFNNHPPDIMHSDRAFLAQLLSRKAPEEAEVTRMVTEYNREHPPSLENYSHITSRGTHDWQELPTAHVPDVPQVLPGFKLASDGMPNPRAQPLSSSRGRAVSAACSRPRDGSYSPTRIRVDGASSTTRAMSATSTRVDDAKSPVINASSTTSKGLESTLDFPGDAMEMHAFPHLFFPARPSSRLISGENLGSPPSSSWSAADIQSQGRKADTSLLYNLARNNQRLKLGPPSSSSLSSTSTLSESQQSGPRSAATTSDVRTKITPSACLSSASSRSEDQTASTSTSTRGNKRHLGMGRTAVGYPNKKFRIPTGDP
ncbi:uncharacterized protein FIBRA_06392 [Fibroporia radiculosa]|uniref:DNA 3'-5' helicase n=1 Tax=Fibroporia radiculosa TaxID=599839 RepID=J4GSN5_9APHY|nr:uncharacterized protein FIBRA_06392 [Fibroporia radiculosa]CCM04225.1 predicted protein [Fibroporia radiculosa]